MQIRNLPTYLYIPATLPEGHDWHYEMAFSGQAGISMAFHCERCHCNASTFDDPYKPGKGKISIHYNRRFQPCQEI